MKIYTIGFTKKSAEDFFEALKKHKVEYLIDIRLNNSSQLAGFTKGNDLKYFLKEICNIKYIHDLDLAPTKEILDGYKNGEIDWEKYEELYIDLLEKREIKDKFNNKYKELDNICFLCSESTANNCHRRLLAEYIKNKICSSVEIIHI